MFNGISSQRTVAGCVCLTHMAASMYVYIYTQYMYMYMCIYTRTRRKREYSLQCNEQFAPNNSKRNITGVITLAKVASSFSPLNLL